MVVRPKDFAASRMTACRARSVGAGSVSSTDLQSVTTFSSLVDLFKFLLDMLPHPLYFRGLEIAQFDRELSPARYHVDSSRFRLHIADRADLMAVFLKHCLTNGQDFL